MPPQPSHAFRDAVTARLLERFAARAGLGPEPGLIDVVEAIRAMPYRRGTDHAAGEDALSTKAALVDAYCDAAVREPFIAALSPAAGRSSRG